MVVTKVGIRCYITIYQPLTKKQPKVSLKQYYDLRKELFYKREQLFTFQM